MSVPKLEPYIGGISWNKDQFDPLVLPQTPILSAIQLSLRPGTDVRDQDQAAARFWEASLDYICSIPNCTMLYWAPLKDHPEILIILLQWEDALAWKAFEKSIGFKLMAGLLTPICFNRALGLALPNSPLLTDRVLELVSFQFPANSPTDVRQQFTRQWEDLSTSAACDNSSDVIITGGWVEPDGPYGQSPDVRALADSQPRYFLGLLFWRTATEAENAGSVLHQKAATLSAGVNNVKSTLTTNLRTESGRSFEQTPSEYLETPIETTSSLLSVRVQRKYRRENGFWKSLDLVASKSLDDYLAGKRLFPGPRGIYLAMGEINQYSLPIKQHRTSPGVIDLVWLKSTISSTEIPSHEFSRLQGNIERRHNVRIHQGRVDNGFVGYIALLVWCGSHDNRIESSPKVNQMISDLAFTYHYSIEGSQQFFGNEPSGKYNELLSFYINSKAIDKELFEYVYSDFESTTNILAAGGIPTACWALGGDWDDKTISRDGIQVLRFSCLISWSNQPGRREWYGDFARGAIESYERFGHIIDRFKLLTVGIESLCIIMESIL